MTILRRAYERENKNLLLTPEERKPYWIKGTKRNKVGFVEQWWAVDELLQAQLFKLLAAGYKSPEDVEEWQADFTDKMAVKYEKRVTEIEAEIREAKKQEREDREDESERATDYFREHGSNY